ncbi:MAG: hypothetical protein NTY02_09535 [Acidobacteria bacterium]|nr:hypothetical protein [Acidobacteriota bacterium]
MARLTALLFPVPRRHLPYSRWWNIAARTIHLGATGILLGAHVFGVSPERLYPFLWIAIVSGLGMVFVEVFPTAHWVHQVAAIFVYAKLALLCAIPFAWAYRVPMLLMVVVLASVGAHAPRRIRHYSVVLRRVMVDEP